MVLAPVVFLLLLEAGLRLFRYGYPTTFFITSGYGTLTTNPKFAWQFYSRENATTPTPLQVKVAKPPGVKRVVILGESAAAGTPDPAYGFARILDTMFQEQFSANHVEFLNVAMRGIDSHIVRQIAEECRPLSPDLFVVYMGNNDMIGLHAPGPHTPGFVANPAFIRLQHAAKATKLAQLMESLARRVLHSGPKSAQDMEYMRRNAVAFDSPRRRPVYENYRANLEAICEMARKIGARVIACTVGVNLHDFPPLQSRHRDNLSPAQISSWEQEYALGSKAEYDRNFEEAVKRFQAAAAIDDHFADLLFRLARCEEATGRADPARKHFSVARDWDALQFRTDSRINGIVREVAAHQGTNQVDFVDIEAALSASPLATVGVPGERLFQEHVHFFFDGDYEVAARLAPAVAGALGLSPRGEWPAREDCARRLAFTRVDAANVLAALAKMTAKAPFLDQLEHQLRQTILERRSKDALQALDAAVAAETEGIYKEAMGRRPDDWMLHYNYAQLLSDMGRAADAVPEYGRVVNLFPRNKTFRHQYGIALLGARRAADAAREFQAALKIDSHFTPAREALQRAYAQAR